MCTARDSTSLTCVSPLPPSFDLRVPDTPSHIYRYCKPKESTRRNRHAHSCLVPSSLASSSRHHLGAPTNPATASLDIVKERMGSGSSQRRNTCCRCQMSFRLTRAQVRRLSCMPGVACGASCDTTLKYGLDNRRRLRLTCPPLCCIGISLTYPTSYEALVGRGKLQAGAWKPRRVCRLPNSLLSYLSHRRVASRVGSSWRRGDSRDPNWQR
jgi:hypothetical protein